MDNQSEDDRNALQVAIAVEVFVRAWEVAADAVGLDAEERHTADALVRMADEVVKSDEPPRAVLKEAFSWLGRKLDLAADEFAKAFGRSSGHAAAVGAGVGVAVATGQLPHLLDALSGVRQALGIG